MSIFFSSPRLLASFTWLRFAWFLGFIVVLSEWSWAGILFTPKVMTFDEHVHYLLAITQRNLIVYGPIYVLVSLADGLSLAGLARKLALAAALTVGILCAMPLRCAVNPDFKYYIYSTPVSYCKASPWWRVYLEYPYALTTPFFIAGMVMIFHFGRRRDGELAARLRSARAAQVEARRQRVEADLLAMQARVEPDALFEALGKVRDLYEIDADVAEAKLDELIAWLRDKAQPGLAGGAA